MAPLRRVLLACGTVVGGVSLTFGRFVFLVEDRGVVSAPRFSWVGLEPRLSGAFRFRVEVEARVEIGGGGGSEEGSAASLAEERVTLEDMSNRSTDRRQAEKGCRGNVDKRFLKLLRCKVRGGGFKESGPWPKWCGEEAVEGFTW
jgi:hypothetical protein